MIGSTILHAGFFTAGAVVGGGIATALAWRKRDVPLPPKAPPVLEVGRTGIPSPVLKHGNPGPIADLLVRKGYIAAYDRRLRHPAWTMEHLTLASLGRSPSTPTILDEEKGDRSKSTFTEDVSLPVSFRAKLQDYIRSSYDRGHMVPAADIRFSQEAMDETFLLSNIAPQVGVGFNRHYWAYLEDWCRRLTETFSDVYVFTVPLYLPHVEADGKLRVTYEVIGSPPNISVPTHFAKVVLAARPASPSTPDVYELSTGAFVLPNAPISDEEKLEKFETRVEFVERAAGLTFFSGAVKSSSKRICQTTKCQLVVRRFDDAQKRPGLRRAISAP